MAWNFLRLRIGNFGKYLLFVKNLPLSYLQFLYMRGILSLQTSSLFFYVRLDLRKRRVRQFNGNLTKDGMRDNRK